MRAALVLMFLLSAGSPAFACHHYSKWSYPQPQSCRVSSALAPAHQRTRFVKIAPEPAPPPAPAPEVEDLAAKAQAIETLKQELLWRAAESLTMEEKHNGD
jgi:hypothetical protein